MFVTKKVLQVKKLNMQGKKIDQKRPEDSLNVTKNHDSSYELKITVNNNY